MGVHQSGGGAGDIPAVLLCPRSVCDSGRTPAADGRTAGPGTGAATGGAGVEYYHDYGVPFGVCHVMGATAPLHTSADALLVVAVHRPRDTQAFTAVERQHLNLLLPHLQRAVQLRQRLGVLEAQVETGFAALEPCPSGVVVVAADGAMVFANAAAEALTRRTRGSGSVGGVMAWARNSRWRRRLCAVSCMR